MARQSYVAHEGAQRTETLSPTRREAEKVKERVKSGPKFVAASNYDMSFTGASGRASPTCRPHTRTALCLPFTETSTSRASYAGHTAAFPERVRGRSPEQRKALPLKSTSIARQSYVDHHVTKVPPRRHEEHRKLPQTKFEAVSTAAASFKPPASASGTAAL